MNSKKISVILPVYNAGTFLTPCIDSVLAQDFKDFELLICDDSSTDESYEKLLIYAENNPTLIRLFRNEENQGLFKSLNFLLKQCESPLIKLWSQDDVMMENCLTAVCSFHLKHPYITMSYHRVDFIDNYGNKTINDKADSTPEIIDLQTYCTISAKWGCMPGNIANVTLVKKYVDKVNGFDTDHKVSGDFDMWTRLVYLAPIGRIDQPLIYLRRHDGQLSNQLSSIYFRIKEDLPIFEQLIANSAPEEKERLHKFFKQKILVNFFNETIYLMKRKQFKLAWLAQLELFKKNRAIFIISRWIQLRIYISLGIRESYYKRLI
ncbi:glycosyltransferase family 2 protein [Pedobacter xixiisoli]|uniref:Glycosyltransferase involved in cell wall bisynthesis n=1 Tax=Pedobacter xixiisoli TaxID=1476464 RepID=A0A286A9L4_9SPHI|nr:glycosyltransferase [Pedobacter xixiisoli]SOD18608.1 Glycosyltransferase involved in cell wall bisynthesis [Pedobacter xixiisoli]